MSTNRYIDKLKARLAKEVDQRMQLQALLGDQVARNRALLAERDRYKTMSDNYCSLGMDANLQLQQLQVEMDTLKRAMSRQVPLHDAIQRAAGELPEGWEIRLCVEHHAGWVELIGPDGTEDFATNNERLDYTVNDALEHALQGAQP